MYLLMYQDLQEIPVYTCGCLGMNISVGVILVRGLNFNKSVDFKISHSEIMVRM